MSTKAIGIDLGTTFSVVAFINKEGRPQTITNTEGDLTTPSVVLIDQDEVSVGKEAARASIIEAEKVADFAKRDIGKSKYHRTVNGHNYPPEVILSLILEKLKVDAERIIGPFSKAVITVPAFFNEPRRKATQDAAKLAGIDVVDIINEPTAAALVYGIEHGFLSQDGNAPEKETLLVYDLGGGTFDVTLMEIEGFEFRTIATAGDVYLGGIDWDQRLVDYIAEKFMLEHRGIDPRKDPRGLQKLRREAEDAKRSLSVRSQITITFEHASEGVRFVVTRDEFESMTEELVERTLFTARNLLSSNHLSWDDISRILLVGGSTRMPRIVERIEAEAKKVVDQSLSADEAVAHGAAIYSGFLQSKGQGPFHRLSITNVNSHSLGILTRDPNSKLMRNSTLIPNNTQLPVTRVRRFRTIREGQKQVKIQIVEGEDPTGKNVTHIGQCLISGLPTDLPVRTPVDVAFNYSESGRITVVAKLPSVGMESQVTIDRSKGLTKDELESWSKKNFSVESME